MFCVLEHLTPLKTDKSCFNHMSKFKADIVSLEVLDRCFCSKIGFLCPTNGQ